jgi:hypothetical protein
MAQPMVVPTANPDSVMQSFATRDLAGRFAFRFSGFTMRNNVPYRLAGVGQFLIDDQGALSGHQRSSITALQGQGAKLMTGNFALAGQITLQNDGTGSASIHFTATDGGGGDVDGEFFVVVAGTPDRLWLVSSGDALPHGGAPADELVDLEAVRMTGR